VHEEHGVDRPARARRAGIVRADDDAAEGGQGGDGGARRHVEEGCGGGAGVAVADDADEDTQNARDAACGAWREASRLVTSVCESITGRLSMRGLQNGGAPVMISRK
jgi:hypothetical protein